VAASTSERKAANPPSPVGSDRRAPRKRVTYWVTCSRHARPPGSGPRGWAGPVPRQVTYWVTCRPGPDLRGGSPLAGDIAAKGAASRWVDLFDGRTLGNWIVRGGAGGYRIEGDMIVGTTIEGSENTYLCTRRDFDDFERRFDVFCDPKLNSGVQIRSRCYDQTTPQASVPTRIREAGEVYGQQCEIAEAALCVSGNFWDEGRWTRWLDDLKARPGACEAFREGRWNTYRIVAQGNRIRSWVTGGALGGYPKCACCPRLHRPPGPQHSLRHGPVRGPLEKHPAARAAARRKGQLSPAPPGVS